jgi:heme/copper-type cytochrome/quinol oxidase subunit 3
MIDNSPESPAQTLAPEKAPPTEKTQPLKSFRLASKQAVLEPKWKLKIGFSFGFFAFIISPIILFQSVLFFLFLLVLEPTQQDENTVGNVTFLLSVAQLLFFSILLFIAINIVVSLLGILFDKKRLWAIMALVLSAVSLLLVFIAPRLIAWQSSLVNLF